MELYIFDPFVGAVSSFLLNIRISIQLYLGNLDGITMAVSGLIPLAITQVLSEYVEADSFRVVAALVNISSESVHILNGVLAFEIASMICLLASSGAGPSTMNSVVYTSCFFTDFKMGGVTAGSGRGVFTVGSNIPLTSEILSDVNLLGLGKASVLLGRFYQKGGAIFSEDIKGFSVSWEILNGTIPVSRQAASFASSGVSIISGDEDIVDCEYSMDGSL